MIRLSDIEWSCPLWSKSQTSYQVIFNLFAAVHVHYVRAAVVITQAAHISQNCHHAQDDIQQNKAKYKIRNTLLLTI